MRRLVWSTSSGHRTPWVESWLLLQGVESDETPGSSACCETLCELLIPNAALIEWFKRLGLLRQPLCQCFGDFQSQRDDCATVGYLTAETFRYDGARIVHCFPLMRC